MLMSVHAINDIAEFLTSRRARVTPEQVGLPTWGSRRVKGLRREKVASLAGVSVEYDKRLERGNASGVVLRILDSMSAPAIVRNSRVDYLAANPLGRGLYCDRGLSDLVGELSSRSQEFRTWWAAHNVRYHRTGSRSQQALDPLASWTATPEPDPAPADQ
jgi:hypothetical protein